MVESINKGTFDLKKRIDYGKGQGFQANSGTVSNIDTEKIELSSETIEQTDSYNGVADIENIYKEIDTANKTLDKCLKHYNLADEFVRLSDDSNLLATIAFILTLSDLWNLDGAITLDDGTTITTEDDKVIIYNGTSGKRYTYQNNVCTEIRYANGISVLISYDENGNIAGTSALYHGANIDVFGEHNFENGQFGGDQMAFTQNVEELLSDPIIIKMLNECYPDATMEDYEYYLAALTSVGCGYTAFVNSVFKLYEGRESEFKETFGYPMYSIKENGEIDFNYEYMILELFNYVWSDTGYTIQELYGSVSLDGGDEALSGNASSKKVTGTVKCDTNVYNNPEPASYTTFVQWLFKEHGVIIDRKRYSNKDVKKNVMKTIKAGTEEWYKYLHDTNRDEDLKNGHIPYIDIEVNDDSLCKSFYESLLNEGTVIVGSSFVFDLRDINNNIVYDNVGAHAMTVVGINDNGIIVSSWGKRYTINWGNAADLTVTVLKG